MSTTWWNPLNLIAKAADAIESATNSAYLEQKKTMEAEAAALQVVSGAGTVVGAVGLFFGIAKSDISLVLLAAPLTYVCYNMYRVGENYAKVAKNPNEFDSLLGWSEVFGKKNPDIPKLKKCLGENTFYFGVFVDWAVKHVINLK